MSRLTTNYRDLGFYGGVPINRTAGKGISYKKRPSGTTRAKCKATGWVKATPRDVTIRSGGSETKTK
jgi:hypothetical protein